MNEMAISKITAWLKSCTFIDAIFYLLLLLLAGIHLAVFYRLNLVFVDSDQPVMWLGARDYASGHFYEPRFYGQAYNTLMEALFAVPFLWCGLKVFYAVPLVTHLIYLFPIIYTAFYLFKRNYKIQATLFVSVLLCFPLGYDFMVSLPRGFITGLFFSVFFVVNVVEPKRLGFVFINSVMAIVGYTVNPNSVLVSFPFVVYVFLHNYSNWRYYALSACSLLTFFPLYFIFDRFYVNHPEYIKHLLNNDFSIRYFHNNFIYLHDRFAHLFFFSINNTVVFFSGFVLLAILFFIKNKKTFLSFVCLFLLLILAFCTRKAGDGSTWVYYCYSRVFLGLPLSIAMLFTTVDITFGRYNKYVLLLPLLFGMGKFAFFEGELKDSCRENFWNGVHGMRLKDIRNSVSIFKSICKSKSAPVLIVSSDFWMNSFISYGGPATDEAFPKTFGTWEERRYWASDQVRDSVFKRFVFLSPKTNLDKTLSNNLKFEVERVDDYGVFLFKNNTLKHGEFVKLLNTLERN